jgi:hypothetical protein
VSLQLPDCSKIKSYLGQNLIAEQRDTALYEIFLLPMLTGLTGKVFKAPKTFRSDLKRNAWINQSATIDSSVATIDYNTYAAACGPILCTYSVPAAKSILSLEFVSFLGGVSSFLAAIITYLSSLVLSLYIYWRSKSGKSQRSSIRIPSEVEGLELSGVITESNGGSFLSLPFSYLC